ncbi:MAG: DNA-processing protein DprA [Candidatus Saccharibacteria bacterium]
MLNSDKLGVIAYLNDRPDESINLPLQSLSYEEIDHVLDDFINSGRTALSREGGYALKLLQDRPMEKAVLLRTIGRVETYLNRGMKIVTIWDSSYPNSLRLIQDPPLLLYVAGERFPGEKRLAIAGAKGPSKKGLALAYEFGAKLAKSGHTIVSGLGKGVDVEAQNGCLSAGGTSLVILGTPITEIYPKENGPLAEEISRNGAVVSDITEEASLYPGRIYHRYRITSGISDALIIIEPSEEGAYRQAEIAIRQGRKVFTVDPGSSANQENKDGFKRLRKIGAVPVQYPEEVKVSVPTQRKLF